MWLIIGTDITQLKRVYKGVKRDKSTSLPVLTPLFSFTQNKEEIL